MQRTRNYRTLSLAAAAALYGMGILGSTSAHGTTYYWDGNGATTGSGATILNGTWGTSAFWGTDPAGASATTNAAITSADSVVFSANDGVGANNYNGAYTVTLTAGQSIAGLTINGATVGSGNTGGTLRLAGTGSPGLTIGAGGITLNGSNGDPTFDASLGTITLAADQSWVAANLHVLVVNAGVTGNATSGNTRTLTLGVLPAFTSTYSGIFSDGAAGGNLALTVNETSGNAGSAHNITGTNSSFTGKTTIQQGILQISSLKNVGGGNSSLGAPTTIANGTIDMGNGANGATLIYNGSSPSNSDRVINFASTTGGITLANNNGNSANTFTLTSAFTNAAGAKTLTLRGVNAGANTLTAPIANATNGDALTLTKSEAGQWILAASNAYTGGTNINGGTLTVSPTGTLGGNTVGNNITISGGNLLLNAVTNYGNNQAVTVNSGGIGVAYTPAAVPTITDNTGATGGVYGINYVGDGAVSSLATLFNGNWYLGSFASGTFNGATLGAGNGSKYRLGGGGGTLTISNGVLTGANDLAVGGTGGGTVILSGTNTFTGKTTLAIGTLSVSSVNSVSGGTASSALGAPSSASNGTIDIGSGSNAVTFKYTGTGENSDRVINFTGTTGAIGFQNSGTGNINFNSTATFSASGAKTFTFGTSADAFGGTVGPIIDNGGVATVVKNGTSNSSWVLNGSNTYTGRTTINGGVLSTSGVLSNSPTITLAGSSGQMAVLQGAGTISRQLGTSSSRLDWGTYSGFAAKGGTLTLNLTNNGGIAGGTLTWGSGSFMGTGTAPLVFGSTTADSQVELKNGINFNTTDTFNRVIYVEKGLGGDSALLSGVIAQGTGLLSNNGFVKDGKGTLVLSGTNTYGGVTNIQQGTLVAGTDALNGVAGAFGTGTGPTSAPIAATAVQLGTGATGSGGNPSLIIGGAFTVGRNITITDGGTNNTYTLGGGTNASSTFSGNISFANGTANNNQLLITQVATTGTNALNISGILAGGATGAAKTINFANVGAVVVSNSGISNGPGGGTVAVIQSGPGTTTFSAGTIIYTGSTFISGGVLQIGNGGTTGTLGSGAVTNNASLIINRSNAHTVANAISGAGTLIHSGTGTTTFSGSSNYTGATTINAGTLALSTSGSIDNSSTIKVSSGAGFDVSAKVGGYTFGNTITGSGTVNGSLNANGNVQPGDTVGTMTLVGNLTLGSTATSTFELASTTSFDRLVGITDFTAGGSLVVTTSGGGPAFAAGQTYDLFDWTGPASTTTFSSITLPTLSGSLAWKTFGSQQFDYTDGHIEVISAGAPSSAWNVDANGNWSSTSSWSSGTVPTGAGATAEFGSAISSARTVTVDSPQTVGTISFSNASKYTLAGGNTVTLDTTTGTPAITVSSGSHDIDAAVAINKNTTVTVTNSADTLKLTNLQSTANALTKNGAGTLEVNTVRASGLTINAGSVAISTSDGDNAGPGIRGAAGSVMKVNNLTIGATAKLDLKNNGVIIPAAGNLNGSAITVDTLRAAIIAGRGGVGTGAATWSGAGGIGTSVFAFDETFDSIGYCWTGDPNLLVGPTDINGEAYDSGDYVVKYCAGADADLNGLVDDTDVAVIGLTYDGGASTGHHWYEGDFNYDGLINDDDVAIIGLAYNPGATPLSPSFYAALSAEYGSSFASAFASGAGTVVPEPASLSLLAIGAMGLLRRRRK